MRTNIALLIEQAANVIDSLNTGIRLTQDEQTFICEHFTREKIKRMISQLKVEILRITYIL